MPKIIQYIGFGIILVLIYLKRKQLKFMKCFVKITRAKVCLIILLVAAAFQSCELADELTGTAATIAKLEGEWTCDEQSEFYKSTAEVYAVTISADADNSSGVIIDNFYGLNVSVDANISGMSLIIPNQTVEGGFTVSGSGTISSNFEKIDLNYTVDDGSDVIDHVTAEYTKN